MTALSAIPVSDEPWRIADQVGRCVAHLNAAGVDATVVLLPPDVLTDVTAMFGLDVVHVPGLTAPTVGVRAR
jgi:hypothetical protein